MAKPLVFDFNGCEYSFAMTKIDRAKLYGYKELEILDDDGNRCELATLAEDGHTLVGRGGTGIGHWSADGHWCDKSQLTPVNLDGEKIEPIKSSFSAPIDLVEPTTVDDYMEHTIRSVYLMEFDDGNPLVEHLRAGAIFKFDYSFRGGLEPDRGFLLAGEDQNIFLAVGNETKIEFVGLQQAAAVTVMDVETTDEEEDLMDFGMI